LKYLVSFESRFGNELAEFSDPGSVEDFISGFADLLVEDGFIREDSMDYMSIRVAKSYTHIYEDGSIVKILLSES